MNKRITVALSSVLLVGGISASIVSTSTPVQAAHHSASSSYWYKNRKVKVTKTIKFRKFDALRCRYVRETKTYRKGKVIRVRAAGEFPGWVLSSTKAGSRYWWISERANTSWMTEYHKPKSKPKSKYNYSFLDSKPKKYYQPGFEGNTYTSSNGSKATFSNLSVHAVTEKFLSDDGKHELTHNNYVLILHGVFTNNGKSIDSIEDWISNKFIIGSNGNDIYNDSQDNISSHNQDFESCSSKYNDIIFNSTFSFLKHGKTQNFAICYEFKDTKVPTYLTLTSIDDSSSYKLVAVPDSTFTM